MQHLRTFKKHDITVERETRDENWYIRVKAPCGMHAYDGWWADSADKTAAEAFKEAKRGACLLPAAQGTKP